jgi:beta-glucosidase
MDIETYFLGSLLSGGGSGPKNRADYNLKGWTDMVDSYQKHALNTRLAIPLLYGIDAVHGDNNIPGATIFPHHIGLGCTNDPDLITKIEVATADEVRSTGINWVFAPCVTVPQDERWGRTYEGYSDDPAIVSLLGAASVRGFQGSSLSDPTSVLACAKHFIGDGGTSVASARGRGAEGATNVRLDQGDTRVDEATLRKLFLPPYIAAVNAGVGTIMPSYSSWNGVKCSASKHLLTDILKNELGFEGFLISDYNAVDQISPNDYPGSIATSINAGMDMVMMTTKYPTFFTTLKDLVNAGTVPMSRIDDAVTRILRVKLAAGLLDPKRSPLADRSLQKDFGCPEHRAIARQAVAESLVLLKNDKNVLPISRTIGHIHVAGRGADNLGMQCGGWTVNWQGGITPQITQQIIGGTTILSGIKNTVGKNTTVTYSADGTGAAGADLGIVVIGELPYAEGAGDRADLAVFPPDRAATTNGNVVSDRATFANMKAANIPLVVILLSGRPMILGDTLDQSSAFIAAWLPGSEGQGVADILFGDKKPTGKLSYLWPKTMAQIPVSATTRPEAEKPLFPLGFGLTYGG